MKILFVSSEITPFSKTGNLANFASTLPKVLKEWDHDIRLFTPKYGTINERKYTLREVIRLKNIEVPQWAQVCYASVKSAFLPDTKVQVYFVENKDYFDRPGFYTDPMTNQEFDDNAERFIFFCRSIFEILKTLHWQPDIIHCNDWQTALIPFFLKAIYKDDPFFNKTRSIISIHNLADQGIFDKAVISFIGKTEERFNFDGALTFQGKLNFLKAGIRYADLINTTSKRFAREIQASDEFAFGLHEMLRKRSKQLYGIVNGVDYSVWNPEIDTFIPHTYSRKDLAGKLENKKFLAESFGLKFKENTPLIGTILHFTNQDQTSLLVSSIDDLMNMDLQYILLGSGNEHYHKLFQSFIKKYPEKIAIKWDPDDKLVHLIVASCDIILLLCRFEPCGENQLSSLKYGSIPIVNTTSALADIIKEVNLNMKSGYGFLYKEYSSEALLSTIKKAVKIFHDTPAWRKLVERVMKLDFSWHIMAAKYNRLYYKLVK